DSSASEKDYSIVVTFMGLAVSSALLEAKLYFSRVDTLTWQMFYDLVVQNTNTYKQCLKNGPSQREIYQRKVQTIQNGVDNPVWHFFCFKIGLLLYSKMKASVDIWLNLDFVNTKKLRQMKLDSYPDMSLKLRMRMILALTIANTISSICIISLREYCDYFKF